MKLDLIRVLADAMQASDEDQGVYIRPSGLGLALGHEHDGCQLEFYRAAHGAPRRPPTPGELLMFRAGHLMEEYVVSVLRDALPALGWRVEGTQVKTEAFGLTGSLDILLVEEATGQRWVVDVKTKRGGAFRYLDRPKPGNVLQVQFYLAGQNADGGALLYMDREGQNFGVQFAVERDDSRPERAVDVLRDILSDPEPPEPVPPKLSVRKNKGADSVYLDEPWQWGWCRLQTCECAARYGHVPTDTMVCKVHLPGADGARRVEFLVDLTDEWREWVLVQLREVYDETLR